MRIAAFLLLIVCFVGLPATALLGRAVSAPGEHESALSHEGQPPIVRGHSQSRLPLFRFCTVRSEGWAVPEDRVGPLAGGAWPVWAASAFAIRADVVLRI